MQLHDHLSAFPPSAEEVRMARHIVTSAEAGDQRAEMREMAWAVLSFDLRRRKATAARRRILFGGDAA